MRATYLAVFLLPFAAACGDGSGNEDPDETGDGDGDMSTGGTASGGGTSTVAEHEAACRAFCEGAYTTQCGDGCPETCDGYANTHGEECAALGVDFFDCMAAEDPSAYNCDAGIIQTVTDGCQFEQDDLSACRSLDGILCERKPNYDDECTSSSEPFAFFCVSAAVPADCSYVSTSTYCCPTE